MTSSSASSAKAGEIWYARSVRWAPRWARTRGIPVLFGARDPLAKVRGPLQALVLARDSSLVRWPRSAQTCLINRSGDPRTGTARNPCCNASKSTGFGQVTRNARSKDQARRGERIEKSGQTMAEARNARSKDRARRGGRGRLVDVRDERLGTRDRRIRCGERGHERRRDHLHSGHSEREIEGSDTAS